MQMHYIYLGNPNEPLIRRVLTLLERQRDPAQKDGCFHPRAKLWTLNHAMKEIALRILAALQPDPPHPTVHLEIVATTALLLSATRNPVTRYIGASAEEEEKCTPEEREVYRTATKMLYIYFKYLLNSDSLIGGAAGLTTVREFVTGKELLANWVSYTYGGVILDAGCEASAETWGFNTPIPSFYLPYVKTDINPSGFTASLPTQGRELREGGCERFYMEQIWNFLQDYQILETPMPKSPPKLHTPNIDNWLLVSSPLCLVPLYALRMHLLCLPWVYVPMQKNGNRDQLFEKRRQGLFATFSAFVATNALLQGCFEYITQYPHDASEHLIFRTHEGDLDYLNINRLLLPATMETVNGWALVLKEGITKNISQPRLDRGGNVLNGWRASLTHTQSLCVLSRFRVVKNQWDRLWDQLLTIF